MVLETVLRKAVSVCKALSIRICARARATGHGAPSCSLPVGAVVEVVVVRRVDDEFGVCMHAIELYKSSPGQDSLPHASTQRGQSLGHGVRA